MANFKDPACRSRTSLSFSILLVGAGVLLFLGNLGWLPIDVRHIWELWPLIFVQLGVGKLVRTKRNGARMAAGIMVLFGVIFTLVTLGIIPAHLRSDSWPLSLLFVALGVGGLAKVFDSGGTRSGMAMPMAASGTANAPVDGVAPEPETAKENWSGWSKQEEFMDSPILENVALLASIKRRAESLNFQGGSLTAMLGSIELDLRRCRMPEGRSAVTVDANSIMGSIKLRVPETWRVAWNGINVMGAYEDKTVPPVAGNAAPELIMTGYLVMGSIEVES